MNGAFVARTRGNLAAAMVDSAGKGLVSRRPGLSGNVDMRFPGSGAATLDVDAMTLAIASRDAGPLAAGSATLSEAVALVAAQIPGQLTMAELDAGAGAPPHYDIDILLPQGALARLKVDTATRQIAWREPAIVANRTFAGERRPD